jgi:hypothetical protein
MFNSYIMMIGSDDVTGFLSSLTADQVVGFSSESQKFTIELANPGGIWHMQWEMRDRIACWLFRAHEQVIKDVGVETYYLDSYGVKIPQLAGLNLYNYKIKVQQDPKYPDDRKNPDPFYYLTPRGSEEDKTKIQLDLIEPLFIGEVQDIKFDQTVKINGACKTARAATALLGSIDIKPSEASAKSLAQNVCSSLGLKLSWFEDESGSGDDVDMQKGGITMTTVITDHDALDGAAKLTGAVYYTNEGGKVVFSRMEPTNKTFYLDGLIVNPAAVVNAVGFCNFVRVQGGGYEGPQTAAHAMQTTYNKDMLDITYPPGPPTDGTPDSRTDQEKKDYEAANVAKYGVLIAPIQVEISLTTIESVKARARQLWRAYKSFNDVVPVEIIGFSPPLRSYVIFNVYYWNRFNPEPLNQTVRGTVKRKVTKFGQNGWTCTAHVATKIKKEGASP